MSPVSNPISKYKFSTDNVGFPDISILKSPFSHEKMSSPLPPMNSNFPPTFMLSPSISNSTPDIDQEFL